MKWDKFKLLLIITLILISIGQFQVNGDSNDISRLTETILQTPAPPIITTQTNYPVAHDSYKSPHYQVGTNFFRNHFNSLSLKPYKPIVRCLCSCFVFKATKSNMRISVKAVGNNDRYGTRHIVHEIPYHDDKVLKIYPIIHTKQIFKIVKML